MEQEIQRILSWHKQGILTTKKASWHIQVLHGSRKSVTCLLDRLPKDCSIIQCTSSHSCEGCGHFKP